MYNHEQFIRQAIEVAHKGMHENKGGPFGCIIVKDGDIIATGCNSVTSMLDPTAHAEMVAIREACRKLNSFQLTGCTLYSSCEPCPMCLGAIYWARPEQVFFAASRTDAANAGFDDDFIYREIALPPQQRKLKFTPLIQDSALAVFEEWNRKTDKIRY